MENRNYIIMLYDFYGELLSEKQRIYFEEYYFNNLSLGEISKNLNISRNAVHKSILLSEEKLKFYEEKLRLYDKTNKIHDIIKEIDDDKLKKRLKELIGWNT